MCFVWHEIFAGASFCRWAIFCVLQEVSLRLGQIGFFLLEINQLRISESSQYYGVRTLTKTGILLFNALFLNVRHKL